MKAANKGFLVLLTLIGLTIAGLTYLEKKEQALATPLAGGGQREEKPVTVDVRLVQDKVLQGSDGQVGMELTLTGKRFAPQAPTKAQPVDLVVVLDRSGSMEGSKINDARAAIIELMERLTPRDRIAVLSYANSVRVDAGLVPLDGTVMRDLVSRVQMIHAGGGTNLGAGLERAISLFKHSASSDRQKRVILISDGLANQGITDSRSLAAMAANGTEYGLAISTVGVGYDFNEVLMSTIADFGSGNYYYLENPGAFAAVFEKEFEQTRNVVASGLELRIPLAEGVELIDAGGYPILYEGAEAVIKPGDLQSGQTRQIFFTYTVPSEDVKSYSLGNIRVNYDHEGRQMQTVSDSRLHVACIRDREAVVDSIDRGVWSRQVVQNDYNRLKENVASAIREGDKKEALKSIEEYELRNRSMNDRIGSSEVTKNLDDEVVGLKKSVEETFTGAPAAVAEKTKQQAKALQYESYQLRRDKKHE